MNLADRFRGVLWGTAIGDALGLPFEGMPARAIARVASLDRYRFFGGVGFVSDDTEQSALVAQSLARHPRDRDAFVRAFRGALLGWFLRLPWGIGYGTLRACAKIAIGLRRSGVRSAGNGAAMRAAIVGAFFFDDANARRTWVDAISRVTHVDARAVEGARFVAEIAARSMASNARAAIATTALDVVEDNELRVALERAIALAQSDQEPERAFEEIGVTGFVVHSVPLATYAFVRFGDDPIRAMTSVIRAGGDADTNAAIVGAWMGALHGAGAFPGRLVERLQRGPFGRAHLDRLADALTSARDAPQRVSFAWWLAVVRNVAMYPVVVLHAVRVVLSR